MSQKVEKKRGGKHKFRIKMTHLVPLTVNKNKHSSQCISEKFQNWGQIEDSTYFQVGRGELGHIQKAGYPNDSAISTATPEATRN